MLQRKSRQTKRNSQSFFRKQSTDHLQLSTGSRELQLSAVGVFSLSTSYYCTVKFTVLLRPLIKRKRSPQDTPRTLLQNLQSRNTKLLLRGIKYIRVWVQQFRSDYCSTQAVVRFRAIIPSQVQRSLANN